MSTETFFYCTLVRFYQKRVDVVSGFFLFLESLFLFLYDNLIIYFSLILGFLIIIIIIFCNFLDFLFFTSTTNSV